MDSFNTFIANKSITKSLVWSRSRSLHYGNLGDLEGHRKLENGK